MNIVCCVFIAHVLYPAPQGLKPCTDRKKLLYQTLAAKYLWPKNELHTNANALFILQQTLNLNPFVLSYFILYIFEFISFVSSFNMWNYFDF